MITSLGWGIIATVAIIAIVIGEIVIVKEKYAEKVASVALGLQVVALIMLSLGTKEMQQFALGQIVAYAGMVCIIMAWAWGRDWLETKKERK